MPSLSNLSWMQVDPRPDAEARPADQFAGLVSYRPSPGPRATRRAESLSDATGLRRRASPEPSPRAARPQPVEPNPDPTIDRAQPQTTMSLTIADRKLRRDSNHGCARRKARFLLVDLNDSLPQRNPFSRDYLGTRFGRELRPRVTLRTRYAAATL